MKKSMLYLLFVVMIGWGLFFAIQVRQPLGFAVAASGLISIIYFVLREDK